MKIVVMDSTNVCIEVLNVPDHMISEDIEQFLTEHDYSLNNISWMAAPSTLCRCNSMITASAKPTERLFIQHVKQGSKYDSVQEVKHREHKNLQPHFDFMERRLMMAICAVCVAFLTHDSAIQTSSMALAARSGDFGHFTIDC